MKHAVNSQTDFERCEIVRRHTKDRGKYVTTRWQDVARDLFAELEQTRAKVETSERETACYRGTLSDSARLLDCDPVAVDIHVSRLIASAAKQDTIRLDYLCKFTEFRFRVYDSIEKSYLKEQYAQGVVIRPVIDAAMEKWPTP